MSSAHIIRPDHSEVTVVRGLHGERRIETVRPDRSRLVSMGPNRGYLERPLSSRPGFVARTYVVGGRPYVSVYRTYSYRGAVYYRYMPRAYYHLGFYAWAYNPWQEPVYYTWGWRRERWYSYYGPYFTPYSAYPSAALWLTDFLLAENLRLAYESRQAADAPAQYSTQYEGPPGGPQNAAFALTPEIKQAIAEEVRQQLAAEQMAAAQPPSANFQQSGYSNQEAPPALDSKQRIFVVSMNLDVFAGGRACALTPGDIILRTGDMLDGGRVGINVLNSKPGDCPINSATEIEVSTLQEMHNQFREQIDAGLKTLADNQGQGGLPTGPPADPRQVLEAQAAPDLSAEAALLRQQQEANQTETEIHQGANTIQSNM